MIEVEAVVEDQRWSALGDLDALARRAAEAAMSVAARDAATEVAAGAPTERAEIAVLFADDDALRHLNRTWRGKDQPTNVLSFPAAVPGGAPADSGGRHLGDVALGYETVLREAEADGKSLADHVTHLIVHGTLHLLGQDHEAEAEAEIMEALERQALARLGVQDPYRDGAVDEARQG